MNQRSLEEIVGAKYVDETRALPGVPVAHPGSVDEARALLQLAAIDDLPLVLLGHGSKLGWSGLVAAPRLGVSTTRLSGIVEFEPGDGTLTALAGTTMAELDSTTREAGLAVTPDVARAEGATLGGTLAAAASGVDRLALGPSRLHVLGSRVLQLNGDLTRSGGNLVKNVTGFDLMRLYCGSFGSLALIVEASLRLGPAPEATVVLSRPCEDLELDLRRAAELLASRPTPRTLMFENQTQPGTWTQHVVLSGRRAHVEHEREQARIHLGDATVTQNAEAESLARDLRELEPDSNDRPVLHLGTQPSKLRPVIGELFDAVGSHDGVRAVIHPGIATIDLALGETSFGDSPDALRELRNALRPLGASASLRGAAPLGGEFELQSIDPLRSALSERIRLKYDPESLLCTRPPLGSFR